MDLYQIVNQSDATVCPVQALVQLIPYSSHLQPECCVGGQPEILAWYWIFLTNQLCFVDYIQSSDILNKNPTEFEPQ